MWIKMPNIRVSSSQIKQPRQIATLRVCVFARDPDKLFHELLTGNILIKQLDNSREKPVRASAKFPIEKVSKET